MAMAIYGMGVVLAPAVGPVLGGWLTYFYGWPWIFFINVPVSIAGIFMVAAFVHDPHYLRRGIRKIDWLGIILLTVSLTFMQIVMERGQNENWFESNLIVLGTATCIASLIGLVYWELKIPEPVINFRILGNLSLTLGCAIVLIFGIALFGTTFILPQFTQELLGYPAFQSGLVLAPRAFMLLIFMPIVGRLYNHVDARVLAMIGVGITCWSYYDLSGLTLTTGFWNLVPMLLIMGAGMPFVFVTLSTLALASVSRSDMTDATSMYTLARRVGGNIGYALAATIVARGQQIHRSYLVEHVNPFNPAYAEYSRIASKALGHMGLNAHAMQHAVQFLTDRIVNMQSTMLAYNDVSWIFGLLFLSTIPLVLLLPGRSALK